MPPHPAPSRRQPAEAGFTLVEVLVALAIFAAAAVVLGAGYANVLNAYEKVQAGHDLAADVAAARQAFLLTEDMDEAMAGGDLARPDGRTVQWSAEIEPTTLPDLVTVVLTVEDATSDPSRPARATQRFHLLRPSWSDPADAEQLRDDFRSRVEGIREDPRRR